MSVKIADCSLRDGGYVGNKNFPKEFINGVIKGLVNSNIDLIETGFLQKNVTGESLVYGNSADVKRVIPQNIKNSEFVGFCDNSRYSIECLDKCNGDSITTMKVSFAKHELSDALIFCSKIKELGYKVFIQPMDSLSYTKQEWEDVIGRVNDINPETFALVDTFGAMHLDDLERIFIHTNQFLNKNIKVALHTHNNLGIANALVEEIINLSYKYERDVIVDGSLFGMARGAGNSCTEGIATYLNERYGGKYDINCLSDTIEKYIIPIKKTNFWGYSIPMFICGINDAHTDNINYIINNYKFTYSTMYDIICMMDADKRKRYGKGYSKTDFSVLESVIKKYMGGDSE